MPKHMHKKRPIYSKLIKEFEPVYSKLVIDTVPDLTRIRTILKKDKTKPYFYDELSNFFDYIIKKSGFCIVDNNTKNIEIKTILIPGKPREVFEGLLKELSILLHGHDTDGKNETAIDLTPLMTKWGLTAKDAIKGSIINFGQLVYSVLNNPASSLKKFVLFGVYALAGQPVAGFRLSQSSTNQASTNTDSNHTTIHNMFSNPESEWFKSFASIKIMLEEYASYPFDEENKRIFFKFLNLAFSGDSARILSVDSKEKLFCIAQSELIAKFYSRNDIFNDINELEMLYRLFNIFLKIEHSNWERKILGLVTLYSKAVGVQVVLDKKSKELGWHLTNFFWILNVNFYRHAKADLPELIFKDYFNLLQEMNCEIYRWDQASIFSFRTVLNIHRQLRFTFYENREICDYLDQSVQDYVNQILRLTENQCFSLSNTEIKECTYIEYVRSLTEDKKYLFDKISQPVEKTTVFPYFYLYETPDRAFTIEVRHQGLTHGEENSINQAILNTYRRVEKLKVRLAVSAKPLTDKIFRLHVFKTNEQYVKYGPLWGVNTAGGGYAHVRSPSESELPSYFRQRSEGDLWYETFIYQQVGDVRNRKDKEGGGFRNLGHEIQHTLFYALVGERELNNLPSWMIEGGANALGNEACFKEEADYIKGFKDKLPTIARIINMSYASGGGLYYFGSALFRFMLARHPNLLRETIIKAQNGKKLDEINQFIKASFTYEQEFKIWVAETINDCSVRELNKDNSKNADNSWQDQYRQALKNSPKLIKFIDKHGPIEFTFSDIVFVLNTDQLSCRSDRDKTTKACTVHDYEWFKSALEIDMLKNKLKRIGLEINDADRFIQELVDSKGEQFTIREIKSVGIQRGNGDDLRTELDLSVEDFVLKGPFLSKKLKQRLEQVGAFNSTTLAFILREMVDGPSNCAAYLKTGVKQALSPQSTTLSPLAIATLMSNISVLLLNATTANVPALTSDEPTRTDDSNLDNWQLPVTVSAVALVGFVATALSFWCYKRKIEKSQQIKVVSTSSRDETYFLPNNIFFRRRVEASNPDWNMQCVQPEERVNLML